MDKINNPHDNFFRKTWSDPRVAGDFLANYLPENVAKHIDLNRLKIQSGSFVDRDLQEHYSDVLYEVGVKEDKIMTIAQELFEKGMKEGMQQG